MKILTYSILAIIAAMILALLGFYWTLLFPSKIIAFPQNPIKLSQTIYHPNDTVNFSVPYCKYLDVVGDHIITLEDSVILPVYENSRFLPLGCHTAVYPIVLVTATPPGKYHFVLRIEYQIPYLFFAGEKRNYTVSSSEFYVTEK